MDVRKLVSRGKREREEGGGGEREREGGGGGEGEREEMASCRWR
jgi:hypothetical protein